MSNSFQRPIDQQRPPQLPYRAAARLLLLGLCLVLWTACGGMASSDPEVDREELQATLEAYLPKLAEAYETWDASVLEEFAVPKEVATVQHNLNLLKQEGRHLRPNFKQVTVEDFKVWNHSNAFVTTFEIWDLRVYALGTDTLTSEAIGQRNRVKYQMKRVEDDWKVLLRQIEPAIQS